MPLRHSQRFVSRVISRPSQTGNQYKPPNQVESYLLDWNASKLTQKGFVYMSFLKEVHSREDGEGLGDVGQVRVSFQVMLQRVLQTDPKGELRSKLFLNCSYALNNRPSYF